MDDPQRAQLPDAAGRHPGDRGGRRRPRVRREARAREPPRAGDRPALPRRRLLHFVPPARLHARRLHRHDLRRASRLAVLARARGRRRRVARAFPAAGPDPRERLRRALDQDPRRHGRLRGGARAPLAQAGARPARALRRHARAAAGHAHGAGRGDLERRRLRARLPGARPLEARDVARAPRAPRPRRAPDLGPLGALLLRRPAAVARLGALDGDDVLRLLRGRHVARGRRLPAPRRRVRRVDPRRGLERRARPPRRAPPGREGPRGRRRPGRRPQVRARA